MKKIIVFGVFSFGLIVLLAVAFTGTVAFAQTSEGTPAGDAQQAPWQGASSMIHRGAGHPKMDLDYDSYLAEALGISVESLQAAYNEAREAAIQEALEAGLITQEQADKLLEGEYRLRRKGFGRGGIPGARDGIDFHALLAAALNVSVDELEEARNTALAAALEQAVSDGAITQEQADLKLAMQALKGYLDKGDLMAAALGITPEALEEALAEGQTPAELWAESGLTPEEVRTAMTNAYQEVLEQAVQDGVITQAQADLLQNRNGDGPGVRGFRPGRGFCGHGGFGGQGAPATPAGDDAPTRLSF